MTNPLQIAIVCYPSLGGSGVVAADVAAGLAHRGHRVHIIASAPPSRPLPESQNLYFHEIRVADYPLFEHPPYGVAVAAAIVEVAQHSRLDIVNVHYAVPHSTSAYLARQVLGPLAPRMITTLHGTDVTRVGVDPSYQSITAFTVAQSDALTVPSEYLCREAHRLLQLPEGTAIDVIPNFVDTDHFHPPAQRDRGRLRAFFPNETEDAPILVHVSNFRPVKRVVDLMEALARVRRVLPARLLLIGDGPERGRAAQRAQELGLADSVCFLGKRSDFADYLRHCDAFLLPSESESFGVAALEALSSGVPVAGYAVGGLPEVVTPDAGTLVAPFDVDALATAVVAIVADPVVRESMGAAARHRAVSRFDRGAALDRYEQVFRRVAGTPRRHLGERGTA
jgi:N-acetyl-alpha-D-glucosaminyl L-malate synthase BshA